MPEPVRNRIDAETCPIHQTPLVKIQNHVGAGKVEWSAPYCPLCEELKAAGKYDDAVASIEADKAQRAQAKAVPADNPATAAAAPTGSEKIPVITRDPAAKT